MEEKILLKARQAFTIKKIFCKRNSRDFNFCIVVYIYVCVCTWMCVCVNVKSPVQACHADHSIEPVRNIIQTYRPRNDKDFTMGIYTHRTLKPNKETLYHLFKDYIIYVFHHLTGERRLFTLICWCSNFKHTIWYVESIWNKTHLIDHGVTNPKAVAGKEGNCVKHRECTIFTHLYTRTLYVMFVIKSTLHDRKIKK